MKATRRKRPRPSQFLHGIDFWAFPIVQVAVLMLFLAVPASHPRHSVDLPTTEHATTMPGEVREDAMLITVTRDGNVFFGTTKIVCSDLPLAIRDSLRRGSERKVYLKVDARAKYGDAAVVIDQIRQAGIQNIGIITEQREPQHTATFQHVAATAGKNTLFLAHKA